MFNYIDFLSPPITLYHLENRTHTSKMGGFFVIVILSLIISYISFLLYQLINHKNIISIFYKQFQLEREYYSFNSSSLFNFIKFFSPENGGYFDKYDSKYIRIYTTYAHSNYSDSNLDLYDHWVFDTCENNDIKDLNSSLFSNVVNFTNSACIRYYYNSKEKKYYSLGDENFLWPFLENGISQSDNIYLTTIVQKCSNYSVIKELLGVCPTQKEIDDHLNKYFEIYLYFTDIHVDPSNYKYPIKKYLQIIKTPIGTQNTFIENHIHYSPLKIRTREGSIFGTIKDINSFYFDFNRKGSIVNNEKYFTLTKYNYLMQDSIHIYERIYKNAFELLSEIGGVIQCIFSIFFWINFIYNKYIVAYDTYSLFFFVQDEDLNQKKGLKNIFYNFHKIYNKNKSEKRLSVPHKNNIIDNSIKNKEKKNNLTFEKFEIINLNDKNNIKNNYGNSNKNVLYRNFNKFNNDENCSRIKLNINNNIIINKLKQNNNYSKMQREKEISLSYIHNSNINVNENDNNNKIDNKSNNNEHINKIILSQRSIGRIEHNNIKFRIIMNKENRKSLMHFAFMDSVKSCCFKRNKGSHNFLITFRKHLLSEEHLFKNHIKLVLIQKYHKFDENENTNILESYNNL